MKKQSRKKNNRFSVISLVSFFLLLFAIGILTYQLFRPSKEVKAIVGTLNVNTTTGTLNLPGGIWNPSGNVGIGTTAPNAKLEVMNTSDATNEVLRLTRHDNPSQYLQVKIGEDTGQGQGYDFIPRYYNGSTYVDGSTFRINPNGNVGIGTTSPGSALDVNGNITVGSSTGNKWIYTWTASDNNWRIGMSATPPFTTSMNTSHNQYISYGAGAGQGFAVGVNGGNSSLEIAGATHNAYFRGNVGIGTTNPTFKLATIGAAAGTTGLFQAGIVGITNGFTINTDASNNITYSMLTGGQVQGFYQDATGNVGIRTTSPGAKLDVSGAADTGVPAIYPLTVRNPGNFAGTGTNVGIKFELSSGEPTKYVAIESFNSNNWGSSSGLAFVTNNAYTKTKSMVIDYGGNVGIGTTAPGYKLDVTGDINASGHLGVGVAPSASYSISASEIYTNAGGGGINNTANVYTTGVSGAWNGYGGVNTANAYPATTLSDTGNMYGTLSYAQNVDVGTLANARGVYSIVNNNTTGIITNAYGVHSLVQNASTGTITNAFGLYSSISPGTGTITNGYGVYINDVGATNDYGIYQTGATDINYFAGPIGIGTTAPGTQLDVVGNIRASGTTGLTLSGAGADLNFSGTGPNTVSTTNASLGLMTGTGNVGIGTSTPGSKFDVAGAAQIRGTANGSAVLTLGTASSINAVVNSADQMYLNVDSDNNVANTGAQGFHFGVDRSTSSGGTELMTILDNGNVGIGTTAPLSKLSVGGAGYAGAGVSGTGTQYGLYGVGTGTSGYGVVGQATGAGGFAGVYGSGVTGGYDFYGAGPKSYFGGSVQTGSPLNISGTNVGIRGSGDTSNYITIYGPATNGGGGGFFFCDGIATDCSTLANTDTRRVMFTGSGGAMTLRQGLTQNGNPDVAENIRVDDQTIEGGNIVSVADPNLSSADIYTHAKANKSETPYDKTIIGVISSKPGILLNSGGFVGPEKIETPDQRPLTLTGRVPTKVSTENGLIYPGDPITSSSIPGVGMKATKAGQIVGKALEPYNNPNPNVVGKIMILVSISWYDPDVYLTDSGDLKIVGDNNSYSLKGKNDSIIIRIGSFAEVVSAKIRSGIIETKKLVVDGVNILERLNELSNKVDSQQKQIDELKKTVEEMKK